MSATIKFRFYLKSGKVFETVEKLKGSELVSLVDICKESFRDNKAGYFCFDGCCVRLSECDVIEWEVLDENTN